MTYANVDKQNLLGLCSNDKLCVLQQVFFVLAWFLVFIFSRSLLRRIFVLRGQMQRGVASYLESRHCLGEAGCHESSQQNAVQHTHSFFFFFFSPFGDKHVAIKQRTRSEGSTLQFANVWLGSQFPVHSCSQTAVVMMLLPGKM